MNQKTTSKTSERLLSSLLSSMPIPISALFSVSKRKPALPPVPAFDLKFFCCSVNEPEVDPNNTPGLLPFYDDFVEAVRAVEK